MSVSAPPQGPASPSASSPPPTASSAARAADEERRRGLRRMKAVATGLLVAAAVVFALTLGRDGVLGYVHATAEAAMVGALADWFAVTALFRHPLGIPVPHTALIRTRKDALGRSLEEFVAENFLSEAVVRDKVRRAEPGRRAGEWLADRGHAERVTAELATAARGTLRVLRDEDVSAVLDTVLVRRLTAVPWSPSAGRLLRSVVEDRAHGRLVDLLVDTVHGWLLDNEETVVRVVLEQAPDWTPDWLDARVARRVHAEAVRFSREVGTHPDHRVRRALDDLLLRFADDLQHDPATMHRARKLQEGFLAHPDVRAATEALWGTARRLLLEAVDDPRSEVRRRAADGVVALGRRLLDDRPFRDRVERSVEDAAGHVVASYAGEVATVISETVQRWDPEDASRRIELHVGRDLQFVRVNGTVVGGLAGLVLHAVSTTVG